MASIITTLATVFNKNNKILEYLKEAQWWDIFMDTRKQNREIPNSAETIFIVITDITRRSRRKIRYREHNKLKQGKIRTSNKLQIDE